MNTYYSRFLICLMGFASLCLHQRSLGQECNIVYVTPAGVSSGPAGTKANPASFTYGLTLANSTDKNVYMSSGTYIVYNPVYMKSDIILQGGFNATTWEKSNATSTSIYRDNSNLETSPNRLVAIYCIGITNFKLRDLTIRSSNAFGQGTSSYSLYMSGCSNYEVSRCKLIAGNAGNGDNGVNGINGTPGAVGTIGQDGDEKGPCCRTGGIGGSGSFGGSFAGGDAGDGGDRGTADCAWCGNPSHATNGYPGMPGLGPGGGIGGFGGAKIVVCIYPINCKRKDNNDGQDGVAGTDGLPGLAGTDGSAQFTGGFFVPGNGTSGSVGTHGSGGGGGGGGGSLGGIPYDCLFGVPPNWNGSGAGGGGGGEGGEGAGGASGGAGGGGSFAVYLDNNGANGVIKDCQLSPGNPGLGGLGGAGGIGAPGGPGGAGGGQANCNIGAGGDGGNGGTGGNGGPGGRGSQGIYYQLHEDTGGIPVSLLNINTLQQPFVYVKQGGCTEAPVEFSTTSTGTLQWFFGAGSVPSSKIANPAIASYTTTGTKTFTLVVNGIPYTYTDFLEVYSNGAGLNPSILTSISDSDTICPGLIALTSSVTASNYIWYIQHDTIIDTIAGAGFQAIGYSFDSAGVYTVIHKTVNACCGESFADTLTLTVEALITPSINILSSDTTNTVCDGTTLTFSAGVSDVTFPFYQWYVNGAPAGLNSPTFSTSTLTNGDIVNCTVMTMQGCSSGLLDTSNSITTTVVGLPVISCSVDSFTSGQPTFFSAGVVSGGIAPFSYLWDFGDQTSGAGDTVAHIYSSPGVYDVQVNVVDSNGCPGMCDTTINIYSTLSANYEASTYNGCSPLTVVFTNQSVNGVTYLWEFGDSKTSTDVNPTYTYTNPGTYDVTLHVYGPTGNDSAQVTNQIMVLPSPTANFQAFPQIVTTQGDSVYFADNSLNAWTWQWGFGDPSSGSNNYSTLQNPVHYYASDGTYTVSLVVTNAFGCFDSLTITNFITVYFDFVGVGKNNEIANGSLIIYPNPISSELNVEFSSNNDIELQLQLLNMQGQSVLNLGGQYVNAGHHILRYNLEGSSISNGIYMLDININGSHTYNKIIVSK